MTAISIRRDSEPTETPRFRAVAGEHQAVGATPVAERAQKRCEYCRAPEDVFNFPFEVEHITPQAHGGSDDLSNLALDCHACNLYKSDFETGRDEDTQTSA